MALKENKETLANRNDVTKAASKARKHNQGERQIIYESPLTVDELPAYRKRRPALELPANNLFWPDGSLKNITTEYQRCFKKIEPNLAPITRKRPKRSTTLLKLEGRHEFQSEYERSYVQFTERLYRPQLIRRCTNLKLEGVYYHSTDYRENFTAFLLEKRIKLQRRATTLHLLGHMDLETENRRNFVLYQNVLRPPLCKKLTNLHLSEYTSAFVKYKNYEKPKPTLPVNNLRGPIDFAVDSDSSESLQHPLIPHLRSYLYPKSDYPRRSSFRSLSRPTSRPPSRGQERFIDVDLDRPRADIRTQQPSPTTVIIRNSQPKINVPKSDERSLSRWGNKSRTQSVSPRAPSPRYFSKEEKPKSIAKSLPTLHRSNWKSKVYAEDPEPHRRTPISPEFQGGFECQPEYRRAYMNYITRERIPDYSGVSRWKNISAKDDLSNGLSPLKTQLRSRKSPPNLSTDPQKHLELMETAAFGKRCRNSSMSEMSSSDDVLAGAARKSLIPRWSKMPTQARNHQELQEDSESEPAFVVMQ